VSGTKALSLPSSLSGEKTTTFVISVGRIGGGGGGCGSVVVKKMVVPFSQC
jgi:hypothetical protein